VSPAADTRTPGIRRFRIKLLIAMMLVISGMTALGIYLAQKRLAQDAQANFRRDFELELDSLHRLQDLRNAAVADRSRALAQNARIHAALEDNALDLLYPSAREELRDLTDRTPHTPVDAADALHAKFYRFLDGRGAVIVPPPEDAGDLSPGEQAQLALKTAPEKMQTGYLSRRDAAGVPSVDELITVPIQSTETNDVIAALVLGFKPVETDVAGAPIEMTNGILVNGTLRLPGLDRAAETEIAAAVERNAAQAGTKEMSLYIDIEGVPHLLFFKLLNPASTYPPAYEVAVYPLTELLDRQRHLRTQIIVAGIVLCLCGFVVSNFLSRRLSQPVEQLAVVSEENLARRQRAEAQLVTTEEELQRSARFSADASHQLKSPITVLRAGLDSLLARDGFPREVYEEISSLIHQTYRLTGVVEDLLLLSRMDAGKLRLDLKPVDLAHLVEEWADDLRAMPDSGNLRVENDIPANLEVAGDRRFTALVVENLLDNARKYNRPDGAIRVRAQADKDHVDFHVANTGKGIPPEAQPYIFERFHRAGAGKDVPGHGLGLNLAHELMRLHGGELRLVRSDAEWTEFAARFLKPVPAVKIVVAGS